MFSKITFFLFALGVSRLALAGSPPPCLLAAVNTQPNPGDVKDICNQNATMVQSAIVVDCGSDASSALAAFSSTCQSAGVSVSSYVPSSTVSAVPTTILYTSAFFDPNCSCTKTGTFTTTSLVTPTGSNGAGTATATGSGSSTAAAKGAAGKVEVGLIGGTLALAMAGVLNII